MTIKKHAHKLKRKSFRNGEKVFFCVLDNCHYKIDTEMSLGKTAECWRCGKPFNINEYSIRLARPHCNDCTKKEEVLPPTLKLVAIPTPSSLKERLKKVISGTSEEREGDML